MNCYLVTFQCVEDCLYSPKAGGVFEIYQTFYANNSTDLAEMIMEYQEDLEEQSDIIVVYKSFKMVLP